MAATKLLSDNGVASGITGYQLTGGNDGTLQLQTTTAGGTATTAMTIDTSQNVGIGQTPTAYGSTVRNVEASITGATGYTLVSAGTANVKTEIASDESSALGQVGTRTNHALMLKTNNTERMRIDSSGNVGIGTSSPSQKLHVSGGLLQVTRNTQNMFLNPDYNSGGTTSALAVDTGKVLAFMQADTERARISSTGQMSTTDGAGNVKTAYDCRAWVNFNGTGTVAIRASGNVSSITDNGTGNYAVNFTTAMSDANYNMASLCSAPAVDGHNNYICGIRGNLYTNVSASSCPINVTNGGSATQVDVPIVSVAFFR